MYVARRATLMFIVVVLWVSHAGGQNLVLNPDFDTDVAGWLPFGGTLLAWHPLDSGGDPGSGSGLVTNLGDQPGDSSGSRQCIGGLSGEVLYGFAADTLIPSGQTETGHSYLLVQWYSDFDCTGSLGLDESPVLQSTTPDVWLTTVAFAEAPVGTQSARLRLSVWKNEAVGTLDAHFDSVLFEPALFVDDFESGDTLAWSATVP